MPSIFSFDFALSGLIMPVGSVYTQTLLAFHVATGFPPVRSRFSTTRPSRSLQAEFRYEVRCGMSLTSIDSRWRSVSSAPACHGSMPTALIWWASP